MPAEARGTRANLPRAGFSTRLYLAEGEFDQRLPACFKHSATDLVFLD